MTNRSERPAPTRSELLTMSPRDALKAEQDFIVRERRAAVERAKDLAARRVEADAARREQDGGRR